MKFWVSDAHTRSGEALIRALDAAGMEWVAPELPPIATESEVIHAVHEHGVPDVLVFTPRYIEPLSVEHSTEEQVSGAFYKNIMNVFLLNRYLGGAMAAKGGGRILYVGSIHAEKPNGACFAFSSAMGAMKMLCMESALQLGRSNMECVYLEVGAVEGDEELFDNVISGKYDNTAPQMAHQKNPTWDDVAEYALYFAKAPGTMINGASIRLDDAFTLNYRPRTGGDPDWTSSLPEDAR